MDFEQELRKKLCEEEKKSVKDFSCFFMDRNILANITREIIQNFFEIIDSFYFKKYDKKRTSKEILDMTETIEELFKENKLAEMYKKVNFSKEEVLYIQYVKLTGNWRGRKIIGKSEEYAIREILIRKTIMQQFDKEDISEIIEIMQEESKNNTRLKTTCNFFLELLSERPYGIQLEGKIEEEIEKKTERAFNYCINCGGYALKIDNTVFPFMSSKDFNFSKIVSTIMERYPFVRLLGDTQLKEDEYLVMYRASGECGHHFIRVDDDGVVREKDGIDSSGVFNDWNDNLKDAPEAIFAVKKEHKMFGYREKENDKMGLDFEETVTQAIKNKNNNFTYHGHDFSLKKSSAEEVFVTSNGVVVANVLIDGEESITEILEEKKNYVENFSGLIKPVIRNGRMLNLKSFKEKEEYIEQEK